MTRADIPFIVIVWGIFMYQIGAGEASLALCRMPNPLPKVCEIQRVQTSGVSEFPWTHDKGRGELMKSTRLIRLGEVKHRTGYGKSSIYNGIAEGTFPRPVPLGPRAVAWVEDEVQEWIDARIRDRDKRR